MKSNDGLRQQERSNTRNEELSQPAAAPYLLGALWKVNSATIRAHSKHATFLITIELEMLWLFFVIGYGSDYSICILN